MSVTQEKQGEISEKPPRKMRLRLRAKLILIFVTVMLIPIIILTVITWNQILSLGYLLRDISVTDATSALNDGARDNIERMTTDTAAAVAEFLYQRDQDVLLLSKLMPSDEAYMVFSENRNGNLMTMGDWVLADDGMSWVEVNPFVYDGPLNVSSNRENNDKLLGSSFNYRPPDFFDHYHEMFPLYDEITFIDMDGKELFKYVNQETTKINYPMNPEKLDVSNRANTYVKAETYWEELKNLQPGEIYVSDVIGAYVGTNYIGMYTPGVLKNNVPQTHPNYDILQEAANLPVSEFMDVARQQAFAGMENPLGQRFEGIVRWATPVIDFEGEIWGYVTMALNHDHIMEFVDFITPMEKRYTVLSDAYDGNYAFIWDYQCRSIAHPRHHSIVGYNPLTGEPQVPWLEGTIVLERDYINGGFALDDEGRSIPILNANGETQLAQDTPFYYWFTASGRDWLEANPAWNNLSEEPAGTSWGEFYAENNEDREILPQFGERQLRDNSGNPVIGANGYPILDYQSRSKTPARQLTQAGFVGLDGRFLNNAPQCTGWMDLTRNGGSGSFYIYWSNIYKPTTAGAIQYYTGKYSPEIQGNRRGFAFVTIGSGIEDFTEPAVLMGERLIDAINTNSRENVMQLFITSIGVFALVLAVAVLVASSVTSNINKLISGLSRFRMGERQFRLNSKATDEFGALADSFDEMADSLEDSVNSPLIITNLELEIIYINNRALDFINKNLSETVGEPYSDISIYPAGSPSDPITALHEGREAEVFYNIDNDKYYKGTANYLYDHNVIKTGYIIMTADVTEMEIARQKAEQASVAKSNFLSNMSHEIRTPLNAIIGMTSIGTTSTDIEKKNYALGKIHDASKHLLGIINDILDVSKIEANKYTLSTTTFSLDEIISRVVDVINFRVEQKHQKLTVNIDPNIPDTLIGDDQRLAQVITNLLSNAVKFTPEKGSIHLELNLEEEQNGQCTILFMVSDTGIGISKEQQERLFTSFEQAEASTSRRFGGTGLGLVICKGIVEMMGGNIWVESELGKGAVISFTVSLAYERNGKKKALAQSKHEEEETAVVEANFEGKKVLLVEDVEINREIVMALLEPTKLKIECAENGAQAVKAFVSAPTKYDMIFMDIQMPEMDGFTATKLIRESGVERSKEIPIVAMTANAFQEDINKCFDSGMNGHLGKPLSFDMVIKSLEEHLNGKKEN